MSKWKIVDYCIELFGDACIIVFGIWSAFTFHGIITRGWQAFIEPNMWIAYSELSLAILIVLIGIERTYRDIWKTKRRG